MVLDGTIKDSFSIITLLHIHAERCAR